MFTWDQISDHRTFFEAFSWNPLCKNKNNKIYHRKMLVLDIYLSGACHIKSTPEKCQNVSFDLIIITFMILSKRGKQSFCNHVIHSILILAVPMVTKVCTKLCIRCKP